jgi:hypothetical protein
MHSDKQTGRIVGALFLSAMLLGLWSNFGLTGPIFEGGGFLENGATMPLRFGLTVVTALAASAIGMVIAVLAYPILQRATPRLALGYLMLVAAGFATTAVEQGNFLSMQALSQKYAASGGGDPALYEALRGVVSANRNGIHFIDKIMGGASITLFCLALYRGRLVPRLLAGFGMLAGLLQMGAIGRELFSLDFPVLMLAPLALTVLLLSLTLLMRGFRPPPAQAA